MINKSIERLQFLCDTIPKLLTEIDDVSFCKKVSPEKWSKKEILGHLLDSATNNHHRIVRGQFENRPKITYNNHVWSHGNHYKEIDTNNLISFWWMYNIHLLHVIKHLPKEKLTNEVETGEANEKNSMTLEYVIEDYVAHLEYHLHQIVAY